VEIIFGFWRIVYGLVNKKQALIPPYPLQKTSPYPSLSLKKQVLIPYPSRVAGAFPDGNSALMLVCARIGDSIGTKWTKKKGGTGYSRVSKG